jgi:hypothetical protein
MTEVEEQRIADLTAWGIYCRDVADVTFARWQEIQETAKIDKIADALTTTETSAEAVAKLDVEEVTETRAPFRGKRR